MGAAPDEPVQVLRVEQPGMLATIQDLGRSGRRAAGVPPGGAMDRFALAAANLLVGNPEGAAALECALSGPSLTAMSGCLVAITGADFRATLNGQPMPTWEGVFLARGDRLEFAGRSWGARVYVAVAGGLAGDRWLGSVATYLLAGRGGVHGRSLKAGDVLGVAGPQPRPLVAGRELPGPLRPPYRDHAELLTIAGPYIARLPAKDRRTLFQADWTVSRDADRMGYRLEGPELAIDGPELVSFGLTVGCVQLPASGQPILLMADGQTAGGYPVVAAVARCDLPLAAQLMPGDHLRFRETSVEKAQEEWRRRQACLDHLRAPKS
jgi:antagonist of KipI